MWCAVVEGLDCEGKEINVNHEMENCRVKKGSDLSMSQVLDGTRQR